MLRRSVTRRVDNQQCQATQVNLQGIGGSTQVRGGFLSGRATPLHQDTRGLFQEGITEWSVDPPPDVNVVVTR